MVNLEHKLTVDDLIVEYAMYKVKNGYQPNFTISEFIDFLEFFEKRIKVSDAVYDGEVLFERFFEHKGESDWATTNLNGEKESRPHMNMEYDINKEEFVIKVNYRFSDYDKSVINTYFMDNGMSKYDDYDGTAKNIRSIIGEYLKETPRRTLDESTELTEDEIQIGKCTAIQIINYIWKSFVEDNVSKHRWPKQCEYIDKYLFEMDLAEVIGVKSIRNDLINLYKTLSTRIAIMYHEDKALQVSIYSNTYLARANYDLLVNGFEDIIGIAFGPYKSNLAFNLKESTFKESHEVGDVFFDEDDPEVVYSTTSINNDFTRRLVKSIDEIK